MKASKGKEVITHFLRGSSGLHRHTDPDRQAEAVSPFMAQLVSLRAPLLQHSISWSIRKGLPSFKGREHQYHLLMGVKGGA